MEYVAPVLIAAIFAGVIILMLRSRDSDADAFLRAISLAVEEGARERQQHRDMIAHLTEKIQHPEIPHPMVLPSEPGPPPEPDPAFERVGRIFPEDNGGE